MGENGKLLQIFGKVGKAHVAFAKEGVVESESGMVWPVSGGDGEGHSKFTITGGSLLSPSLLTPAPTDGTSNLALVTVRVPEGWPIDESLPLTVGSYGCKDLWPIDGKLYLHLPKGDHTLAEIADGLTAAGYSTKCVSGAYNLQVTIPAEDLRVGSTTEVVAFDFAEYSTPNAVKTMTPSDVRAAVRQVNVVIDPGFILLLK